MPERFKKNKGNMIRSRGEEFVEETLRKNVKHPAQNNPSEEAQR
ncbi:hypothetical protein [Cohnella sp. CFH 77786]|nr:hypothetical protein [Cohnella sp. CFH 77786]